MKNKNRIEVSDFGAGSQVLKSRQRPINQMAKSSLTPPNYCQLLFRLIVHYQPKTILELGSSFGISTLYQGMTGTNSQVITIEGDPKVAAIAREHFQLLGTNNINLLNGPFDEVLPTALKKLEKLDYVFIDGNHRLEPTLLYFEQCLEYAHENSIFIFHDIHWTSEMEEAWKKIQEHPKVRLSIDLFFMGIVFFRTAQKEKEHFELVPSNWKPWVQGFWG